MKKLCRAIFALLILVSAIHPGIGPEIGMPSLCKQWQMQVSLITASKKLKRKIKRSTLPAKPDATNESSIDSILLSQREAAKEAHMAQELRPQNPKRASLGGLSMVLKVAGKLKEKQIKRSSMPAGQSIVLPGIIQEQDQNKKATDYALKTVCKLPAIK